MKAWPAADQPEQRKTYYLILEGESVAQVHTRLKNTRSEQETASEAQNRNAAIHIQHESLVAQLHARGHIVSGRFSYVVNALRVHVPPGKEKELQSLPGVIRVEPARHKRPLLSTSVPFIGAPQVWSALSGAANGTGIRIGIIDTGIDYTHADFGGLGNPNLYTGNDRTRIEFGSFPTPKVAGGYDFVGDSYDASTPGYDVPQPDPDPLDCNGHGTHVAGIAAGFGVLTNGMPYSGAYTSNMDYSRFSVGPGVAPRALLYALKVFGCNGSSDADIDALEWAATAGTGNISNHLDVVNLSLGGAFGYTGATIENDAVTQLVNVGCIVVIAAGNAGNTYYIVGSPGTTDKSICVANSVIGSAIQVVAPSSIAGVLTAAEGDFSYPLSRSGPIQAGVVYVSPGDACGNLINGASLTGKIALIDRGTCYFTDKIQRAQSAGAAGVIVVDNTPEDPFPMSGTPSSPVTIPAVLIKQSDGALLKAHLGENLTVRMGTDVIVAHPALSDQIELSSSRGPTAPQNLLKPEIAAPGTGIRSAAMGTGIDGVTFTGTSMAAPHVAGAAALLHQLHPTWFVEEIKASLMNTARATRDAAGNPQPESRSGAGRVQVNDATRVTVTAKAQNSGGFVTLNLGALELSSAYTQTQNIVLQNHGGTPVSYTVVVSNTVTETGFNVVPLQSNVTVPANSMISVPVQFTATPALFNRTVDPTTPGFIGGQPAQNLFETSGQIWFLNQSLPIHVPYYGSVRAGSSLRSGFTDLGFPSFAASDFSLPITGSSAHPQPLLSAFQLGATSPNQGFSNPANAALDILAVGAASDASSKGLANSTVYFGVAVATNWTSPQTFLEDARIQIDVNADGYPDFELLDSSSGNASSANIFDPTYSSVVFQSVVSDSIGNFIADAGYLNVFPANARDTAPYNNSVMVLSVLTGSLGLSGGYSQINYRAVTFDMNGAQVDQTDWVPFDIAQPLLDTTVYGLGNTPFFPDTNAISLRANSLAAANNGVAANGISSLLLLHHFNVSTSKVEIVNFHLAQNDFSIPFKILPISTTGGTSHTLIWTSLANTTYTVEYSTNLSAGFPFQAATSLSGTPPFNTFVDNTPRGNAVFYRIRKE